MNLKDLKIAFEHTTGEVEIIIAGLRKLPMEVVQELHDRMIKDANAKVQEHIAQNTPEAPNDNLPQT
jgi:hypothetical protein